MSKKFIIAVDNESSKEVESFVTYLKTQGWGWFHRTSNASIITTPRDYNVQTIRDVAVIYFPNRRLYVIDIDSGTWAGWGTKEEFKWFGDNW